MAARVQKVVVKKPPRTKEDSSAKAEATGIFLEGQKRVHRLKQLIEPRTEELIDCMFNIAMNRDVKGKDLEPGKSIHPSIRMEAADRLLSRAYGKPKEHIELEATDDIASGRDEVVGLLNSIFDKLGVPLLETDG